jgi:ethanolaminephosphotransferase
MFGESPNFSSPISPGSAFLAAICLFLYSTLDNMDGKQARKIGASSPLGLLFDHGCDSINTGMLGSLIFAMAVGPGGTSWVLYALWGAVTTAFFLNTWEEYADAVHCVCSPLLTL